MLKAAIVILLLATVASLFSGLFFLVKDEGQGTRLVNALTLRVTLTGLTVALLVWGFYSGQLVSHAPLVERHRIGVTCQQQPPFPLAIGRHQVEFARQVGQCRHLALEAELAEPVGQQPDHRLIALIPAGIRAADRGNRNNILIK